MQDGQTEIYEIAIVGAGLAGLSAALYAARFCRTTLVLHDGKARASRIAKTYNVTGFDEGITGPDLVERMTNHAEQYGAQLVEATVATAVRKDSVFELSSAAGETWRAKSLILATGIILNQIALDEATHEAAIANDVLRYCPVCDGYEHRGKRIAVVGCDLSGASEALFLRQFSDDITLLPKACAELTTKEVSDLAAAGVETITAPITRYAPQADCMEFMSKDKPIRFASTCYIRRWVLPREASWRIAFRSRSTTAAIPTLRHRSALRSPDCFVRAIWSRVSIRLPSLSATARWRRPRRITGCAIRLVKRSRRY